MDDPKYCHYLRCIHHATRNSYVLEKLHTVYDQHEMLEEEEEEEPTSPSRSTKALKIDHRVDRSTY